MGILKDNYIFISKNEHENTFPNLNELNYNLDKLNKSVENLTDSNKNVTIPLSEYNALLEKSNICNEIKNMINDICKEYSDICYNYSRPQIDMINHVKFVKNSLRIVESFDAFHDPRMNDKINVEIELSN